VLRADSIGLLLLQPPAELDSITIREFRIRITSVGGRFKKFPALDKG